MKLKGLYQKRGFWYYQPPQVKGHRPKAIALGTQDQATALLLYEQHTRQQIHEMRSGKLGLEIERYIQSKLAGGYHSPYNSRETRRTLLHLADTIGRGTAVCDVTVDHLRQWQAILQETNSPTSIRSLVARISGFFTWAVGENMRSDNPVRKLQLPKTVKTRAERYCRKEERDRLIDTVDPERPDLALFLWLGFFAGLRPNEIIEARLNWIDLPAGVITVQNTDTFTVKDKAHRHIRISARLQGFLADYLANWGDLPGAGRRDYLLRPDKPPGKKVRDRKKQAWRYRYDPRVPFKKHVTAQAMNWVTPHTLRHTFATLHAIAGTPLTTIAKELGDDPQVVARSYVGYTRHSTHADAVD